jgi:hypothetical protein
MPLVPATISPARRIARWTILRTIFHVSGDASSWHSTRADLRCRCSRSAADSRTVSCTYRIHHRWSAIALMLLAVTLLAIPAWAQSPGAATRDCDLGWSCRSGFQSSAFNDFYRQNRCLSAAPDADGRLPSSRSQGLTKTHLGIGRCSSRDVHRIRVRPHLEPRKSRPIWGAFGAGIGAISGGVVAVWLVSR